jgi:hypothetical protein
MGGLRNLHNEEILYSSPKDDIDKAYSTYGVKRNALVGKPEGKKPLGRPWRMWEDIIKVNLTEIG